MIRFKDIEIENYRQYQNLYVSFDRQDEHDLFMLVADNGVGKTNFLNAITWCLYGEESHLQDKNGALPIINLLTLDEAQIKDKIKVKVSIKLDKDDSLVKITREETYMKQGNDIQNPAHIMSASLSYQELSEEGTIHSKSVDEANDYINKLFPKQIDQYFFFDNEQMNNYFTRNTTDLIFDAIRTITKVNVVDKVIQRLKNLAGEYKRNLSSSDSNLEALEQQTVDAQRKWQDAEAEYKQCQDAIYDIDVKLQKISTEVKGYDDLQKWENTLILEKQKRANFIKQREDNRKAICKFVSEYYPLLKMYPALRKTADTISEIESHKQLPPPIRKEIIETSIKNGRCELCGCELNGNQLHMLEELIGKFKISTPATDCLVANRNKIDELLIKAGNYKDEKERLFEARKNIEELIEQAHDRITELEQKMKSISNKDHINTLLDERSMLEKNKGNRTSMLGQLAQEANEKKKIFNDINDKWDNERKRVSSNTVAAFKYDTTMKLQKILEAVHDEIIQDIRDSISEETTKNYKALLWKKDTYDRIVVDEKYNVLLLDKKGRNARGSTSAAELSLLALAFTTAIHSVSKFDCPIIIDTPLGRVSSDNRTNFSKSLLELSKKKQIILLFTPDEYSPQVAEVFDGNGIKRKGLMTENEKATTFKEE